MGLSTTEACGDTPRVILGCPVAGIDADEIIDGTAEIAAITSEYIGDAAFSNLPRKFKSTISGCAAQCAIHEINDIAFVGVVNAQGETGFDLWVGGGLSTNPMLGKRLGVFVRPDEVAEVWAGVVGALPRLRLPAAAPPGPASSSWSPTGARSGSARCWRRSTSAYALPTARPLPCPATGPATTSACTRQRDGSCYVGFAPTVGRVSGDTLDRLADLASRYGSGRVRTTPQQKLVVLDVPAERIDELVAELDAARPARPAQRRSAAHDGLHRHRVLQAGHRRDQGPRRRPDRRARAAAARLRRARSPSTSTAARTPAPGSRSPTSASRARWSPSLTAVRSRASRSTWAAASAVTARPPGSAARCAAYKITADELPDYVERSYSGGSTSKPGSGRDIRRLDRAGRRRGAFMSEPGRAVLLPVLRRRGPSRRTRIRARRVALPQSARGVSSYALPELESHCEPRCNARPGAADHPGGSRARCEPSPNRPPRNSRTRRPR